MPDIPFFWIIIVGAVIFSAIARGAQRAQARRARAEWAGAADRLEFSLSGTNLKTLKLTGTEGAIRVVVDLVKSDNSTTTRYRVRLPPIGVDLGLSRQSDWHQFTKAFGAQDLEIGIPEFDGRFMVKSNNPDRTRAYLNPARVAALNALAERHPGVSLFDATLIVSTGGVTKTADGLVSTVNHLLEAARELVPDVSLDGPDEIDATPPIADSRGGVDRDAELQQIFETIEGYEADREADPAMSEAVAEAATSAAAASAEEATNLAAAATDHHAAVVADQLFGDQQLGFEVERRFNDEFRDTVVAWTGTFVRHAGISAERKFDGEGHSIVEINVAILEDDLYGRTSVDAVVAFPGGTTIPERGESVRFSGRLIAIDAFTKDLYVADGTIERE